MAKARTAQKTTYTPPAGYTVSRQPKAGLDESKITTIDADVWAESGGTAGMFGRAWKAGTLRIITEQF